jgi:hypothetical protein
MKRIEPGEGGISLVGRDVFDQRLSSVRFRSIRQIRIFKIVNVLNRAAYEHERQLPLGLASTNVNTD